MKSYLKIAFIAIITGCSLGHTDEEYSDVVQERAVIDTTIVCQSSSGSEVGIVGSGVGVPIGNSLQMNSGEDYPEMHITRFYWRKNLLTVDNKKVYEKFKGHSGGIVLLSYRKVYAVRYKKDVNGIDSVVKKTFLNYKFENAELVK